MAIRAGELRIGEPSLNAYYRPGTVIQVSRKQPVTDVPGRHSWTDAGCHIVAMPHKSTSLCLFRLLPLFASRLRLEEGIHGEQEH